MSKEKLTTVRAKADFIKEGYLKMDLDKSDLKDFKEMSEDEQLDWLGESGEAILSTDDEEFPCIEDIVGEISNVEIIE